MNTAPETIDLPHGVGVALAAEGGSVHLDERMDHCGRLWVDEDGRWTSIFLLPAERRWLAAELLFGLEEDQG